MEITSVRRFLVAGLSERRMRELRKILRELDDALGVSARKSNAAEKDPVLLVAVDQDAAVGLPLSFGPIAIVPRTLPDVDNLLRRGFADYITYPFSALEIQRRLFGMPSASGRADMPTNVGVPSMVRSACGFLEVNIARTVGVKELASIMGTNRNTLNKAFNQAFGVGPITWLRQRRCAVAAQLLGEGSESILNIALRVGYEDPNNFSTAFRKIYDQGPMEFRKKFKTHKLAEDANDARG
ncbi:AraC family transcriptional regulator protein (plasmid) [Rhizobium etli]|uniref:AraC family transcriptional regulator protein n=1 Tax=Rhizobium etli TaxID=29449 RepID=A0AAN1BLK2_RHIET|nr:AraC family transcriptional regulator [Rhizobium etli]ARQ13251.1 AraC family transcriptional regulator protein [Rhizobium etli]